MYLDVLWRPWLNGHGPCSCLTGDKWDEASGLWDRASLASGGHKSRKTEGLVE